MTALCQKLGQTFLMAIEVRPPGDRFLTRAEGRTTWHSFSFGAHYDPANVGFGPLVALNDELLPRGTGYDDHPHRDTEIVTWVLSGALRHRDSAGHDAVVGAGEVQVLSAGSGVVHSEVSASAAPTRFVQCWLRPDDTGLDPVYATARPDVRGSLVVVASGSGAGLPVRVGGASLSVALLDPGEQVALPPARRLLVFVATGELLLDGQSLATGSTARLVDEPAHLVTAVMPDTQPLVWQLP
jgi:redox-sensitive bicupin YhaK (pirin superfamily)